MIFSGRVQGVGFRYATCSVAERYDVTGYVRNLVDGTVELAAEGAPDVLDEFVGAVRDAMRGNITDVRISCGDACDEFDDFRVRQ